ncbi:MAG TPA: histidinol-phosphate transaminase [Gemmatimonadota bacterium]|nr:histidinol-phosphate transaminase [Gemmatimonadota bacterium]
MRVSPGSARSAAPPTPARADLDSIAPYVPGRHRAEIARAYGVRDVLKLASNENPLGPSPRALAAARAALEDVHYYPDSQARDLRDALADRHDVEPAQIVLGNGSVECIDLVARAFLRPGDEAVIGFPSFPRFAIACQVIGVAPRVVRHREWRFDLGAMRDAIGERTRVVFLDNPCNPTGTHLGPDELGAFLDDLPAGVLVVLDRAYYEFVPPEDRLADDVDRIQGGENLVVLRTFSKAHGLAGLRVGYAIARPEHAVALDRVREAFNVSSVAQAAALAAMEDVDHVERAVRAAAVEREWLAGELARLGLDPVPSTTNFLFVEFGTRAPEVHEGLHARGVVIRPMSAPGIETHARISLGTRAGNERLVTALEEILE